MATGETEFIDLTTADVFLEEKWSKIATVARKKNLIFGEYLVDRQFEAELKRGQILHIGNVTQPTARAKTANAALTYETVTETESTITINTYYYTAIAIEDVIKPMIAIDVLEKYIPGLSYGLALQEDSDLGALVDDGTISQTVGTLATGLTYDNLVRSDQYLNDANVPPENRAIGISPAEKANFMKMDHFINRDYADLRTGLIGSWMNYPIHVSTNMNGTNAAGHDSFMAHKECIAHVQQIQPVVTSWWDRDYYAAKVSALTTYGSTIRRADHGVWMKSL